MITISGRNSVSWPPIRRWSDRTTYLYVCVFTDIAKVGVSGRLRERVDHLRLEAAGFHAVHFVELPDRIARNIENIIAREFGGATRTKGRASEWFNRQHVERALAMIDDERLPGRTMFWRDRKRAGFPTPRFGEAA